MSALSAKTLAMIEKDKEILKLKTELARQQNPMQQTSEQTLAKQQMEQMIVQIQAERSALKNQV